MRTLPSSLTQQYGTTLDVSLVIDDVGTFTNILVLPEIETRLSIDNVNTQAIELVLDDTDSRLKALVDSNDPSKLQASIVVNTLTVFEGLLVMPIRWSETERSFTLTITSRIEAEEYGFSPERGQLDYVSDDAIGKAWPLVFGSPAYVPSVRVYHQPTATTEDKFCFVDPLLYENRRRINVAFNQAMYMFLHFDEVRANILEAVAALPLANGGIQGYIDLFLELLAQEDAMQVNVNLTITELAEKQETNRVNNDRASAARIVELNTQLEQLSLEANEIALKKDQFAEIIDELERLFNQEKEATAQQIEWLNRTRTIYAQHIQNEHAICEQERCVRTSVRVRGTSLPDGDLTVSVNNVKYDVTISDGTMTLNSGPLPMHTNVPLQAWAEDDEPCVRITNGLDLLRLDDTTNLRGMYLLLRKRNGLDEVRHIVKVTEQIGNKVYYEMVPWKVDGSGGPRGQSVDGLLADVLGLTNLPPDHPFDAGSTFGGFGSDTGFGSTLNDLFNTANLTSSYSDEVRDIINKNPTITLDELRDVVRMISYRRLNDLGGVEFAIPSPQSVYTIVAPDVLTIEAAAGTILPQWFEYYIPPEEYDGEDGFIGNEAGSEVRYGDECEVHVVNLAGSTVHAVHAYRTNRDGNRVLEAVPASYYTVADRDLGKYTTTTLVFDTPLDQLNQNWERQPYVTQTSNVGRNVNTVIDWLFSTYTSLTASSDVSTETAAYPIDCAFFETGDVLTLVKRIMYEARLGLTSTGSTYKLIYLPNKPTAATTITEADIKRGSINESFGNTVVTSLRATWNGGDYLPKDDPYEVVIRNNVPKHGLFETSQEYRIYSAKSLVEKSAQFNMLRGSYMWKRVEMTSTNHKWLIEPFDVVTYEGVDHLVETANMNLVTGELRLVLHSGTIVGESDQFKYFWPKDATVEAWVTNDPYEVTGSIK